MLKIYLKYEGKKYHDFEQSFNTLKAFNNAFMLMNRDVHNKKLCYKCSIKIEYNSKNVNSDYELKFYIDESNNFMTLFSYLYDYLKNRIDRCNSKDNFDLSFKYESLLKLLIAIESDTKRLYKHEFIIETFENGIEVIHTIVSSYQYSFNDLVNVCNNLSDCKSNKIDIDEISWILTNYTLEFLIDSFHSKK